MRGKSARSPKERIRPAWVGVGLVGAEFAFGEVVDIDQIGTRAIGKPIFSHGDATVLMHS